MTCICESCGCKDVCEFYDTAVKPVITLLTTNIFDEPDRYISRLTSAIDEFDCDNFE